MGLRAGDQAPAATTAAASLLEQRPGWRRWPDLLRGFGIRRVTGRSRARATPGAPASIARYVKRRAGRDGQIWVGGALSDQDVRRTGRAAPVFLAACAGSVA